MSSQCYLDSGMYEKREREKKREGKLIHAKEKSFHASIDKIS